MWYLQVGSVLQRMIMLHCTACVRKVVPLQLLPSLSARRRSDQVSGTICSCLPAQTGQCTTSHLLLKFSCLSTWADPVISQASRVKAAACPRSYRTDVQPHARAEQMLTRPHTFCRSTTPTSAATGAASACCTILPPVAAATTASTAAIAPCPSTSHPRACNRLMRAQTRVAVPMTKFRGA